MYLDTHSFDIWNQDKKYWERKYISAVISVKDIAFLIKHFILLLLNYYYFLVKILDVTN